MKDLKIKLGLDINDFKAKMKDAVSSLSDLGKGIKELSGGKGALGNFGGVLENLPKLFGAGNLSSAAMFATVTTGAMAGAKALKGMFDAGINNAKWLGDILGKVAKGAVDLGKKAFGVVKDFTSVGQEYNSQMAKVGAISGATGAEFDKLKNKARELGSNTRYSATEVGQAFEYMGMA